MPIPLLTQPTPTTSGMTEDEFNTSMNRFIDELTPFATGANALAVEVDGTANAAIDAAASAAISANTASAAASSAAADAGAAAWVSGNYSLNQRAISQIDFQTYRCKVAGNRTIDPANDPTNWVRTSGYVIPIGSETRTASATLTSSSKNIQVLAMTGYGKSITLPDAQTLVLGSNIYTLDNSNGKYPVGLIDGSGRVLGQVLEGDIVHLHLIDNASPAGAWKHTGNIDPWFIDTETGIDLASAGAVSTVSLDSTRGLIYYTKPTTGYPAVRLIKDNGAGSAPTVSNELVLKTASTTVDAANGIALVGASNRIIIRLNDNSVVCVNIGTPSSITVGAAATLTFTAGTFDGILALDDQYAIAIANDSAGFLRGKCLDCGVSGTTVTVGAQASTADYAKPATLHRRKTISTDTVGVFGQYNDAGPVAKCIFFTVTRTTGTTLSWSANAGSPTGYRTDASTQLSIYFDVAADKLLIPFYKNAQAPAYVVVTFAASSTPTFGAVSNSNIGGTGLTLGINASPDLTKFISAANGSASAKSIEIVTVSGSTVTVGAAAPITADAALNAAGNIRAFIDDNGRGLVSWKSSIWTAGGNDKMRTFTTSGTTPTFGAEISGATKMQINGLGANTAQYESMQESCGTGVFALKTVTLNSGAGIYKYRVEFFTINSDRTRNVLAVIEGHGSSPSISLIQGGVAGVFVGVNLSEPGADPENEHFVVWSGGGYKKGAGRYWGQGLTWDNNQVAPNKRALRLSFSHPDTRDDRNASIRTYRFAEA